MCHYIQKYCKDYEKIENYDKAKKDNFKNWDCHHRLETHTSDGIRRDVDISHKELKALGMYYNRPSSELIFMKHSEHQFLHHKGKIRSDEAKNKMREAWDYDRHFNEETRKKMSEKAKGNTNTKGMHFFNNGKINIMSKECPDGFVPGRIKKL